MFKNKNKNWRDQIKNTVKINKKKAKLATRLNTRPLFKRGTDRPLRAVLPSCGQYTLKTTLNSKKHYIYPSTTTETQP